MRKVIDRHLCIYINVDMCMFMQFASIAVKNHCSVNPNAIIHSISSV